MAIQTVIDKEFGTVLQGFPVTYIDWGFVKNDAAFSIGTDKTHPPKQYEKNNKEFFHFSYLQFSGPQN
jgi:hypothetical protein